MSLVNSMSVPVESAVKGVKTDDYLVLLLLLLGDVF